MRYNRQSRRLLTRNGDLLLENLRSDFVLMEQNINQGSTWSLEKKKFVMRLWLGENWKWAYWGGTNVVRVDKDIRSKQHAKQWIKKIESAFGDVVEKTNRKLFGRRYFRKVAYPTSFGFYEEGDISTGKHIHTLHHFPASVSANAEKYLSYFSQNWIEHPLNKRVGRTFWYDSVDDQDKATRYATKKMNINYDDGWFVFG